jgi:hypothetical protein
VGICFAGGIQLIQMKKATGLSRGGFGKSGI